MKRIIYIIFAVLLSYYCFATKDKWDANKKDWSKLMIATYNSNHKKMIKLLAKQIDINYSSIRGLNALSIAIRKQDTMAMNILFHSGRLLKDSSENLIMLACSYKSVEVLKILVEQNYPIKNNINGHSPLMTACSFSSKEIIEFLINKGANVNEKREVDGMTPLMFAVYNGNVDKVKMLLNNGADKKIQDKNGKIAVEYIANIPVWLKVKEIDKWEIKYLLEK